jgi:DNA repair ATPase RecN
MRPNRPWQRVLAEGLVILASVLAALAVDAWWDRAQARNLEEEIRAVVVAELRSDSSALEEALARNEVSLAATQEFLASSPPELQALTLEEGEPVSLEILRFSVFGSAAVAAYLFMETPPLDASSLSARSVVGETLRELNGLAEQQRKSELLQNEIRAHLARHQAATVDEEGRTDPVSHDGAALARLREDQALLTSLISKRGLQLGYVRDLREALSGVGAAIRYLERR